MAAALTAPVLTRAPAVAGVHPARSQRFTLEETTVAQIQKALARGKLTCEKLVGGYLARIRYYTFISDNKVDALVHSAGSGSALASLSGYPSVLVPAGLNASGISADIAFLGTAFTEPRPLGYAYAYEQATHHRQFPVHTPPLPSKWS